MESLIPNAKSLETLTEWPLSKVELVEVNGSRYVLKTIHSDFTEEISRQNYLAKNLRPPIFVPTIIEISCAETRTSFLMEYIAGSEASRPEALEAISRLHKQTQNVAAHTSFPSYTLEQFQEDMKRVKDYIPGFPSTDTASVFSSPQSIVHGDWKNSQVLTTNNAFCILDFGKSFYGPSILDYAYYFQDDIEAGLYHSHTINEGIFLTAGLIVQVMQLAWYVRCRDNYIDHDYQKEIKKSQDKIAAITTLLTR